MKKAPAKMFGKFGYKQAPANVKMKPIMKKAPIKATAKQKAMAKAILDSPAKMKKAAMKLKKEGMGMVKKSAMMLKKASSMKMYGKKKK